MNFDQYGLIVQDPPSNDGGDSCNRMGQYYTALGFLNNPAPWPLSSRQECLLTYLNLTDDNGDLRRHKSQVPWNNPKNCSRDQMLPMFTALALNGYKKDLFEQLFNLIYRLGFYQNIERDYRGSRKYPYPHQFINDRGVREKRYFDFADPAQPSDFAIFLRGFFHDTWAKVLAYPILVVFDLWSFIGIWGHLKNKEPKEPCHLLCFYAQSTKQIPTFVSRIVNKLVKNNKARIVQDLTWYFGGRGGFDSPKFVQLWSEVLDA